MAARTREQVMAHLVGVAREASAAGKDGLSEIQSRYPEVPLEVAVLADCEAASEATESWWQSIEKTIEGEVIKNALTKS